MIERSIRESTQIVALLSLELLLGSLYNLWFQFKDSPAWQLFR